MKPPTPSFSTVNEPSTNQHFQTNALYSLSGKFDRWQAFGLLVSGLLFLWLSRNEQLDWAISRYWFDPASGHFPWQNNYWLDLINHRLLKHLVIIAASTALVWGIYRHHPRLILTMLLLGLGPLVVGLLKASSAHSCPWDLVEFGGKAISYPLLGHVPAFAGPGRCFPGGHASSGFAVMALFFLFYPRNRRLAYLCWCAGMLLGMVMGFGQIMRGAHFLTHNLWAGWWVWFSQLAVFGWVDFYRRHK